MSFKNLGAYVPIILGADSQQIEDVDILSEELLSEVLFGPVK